MDRFSPTERIGISYIEQIFLEFKWIPRLILQSDVGIDMEVEICNEGRPTGQLLGVQIKSGKSYFENNTDGNIIYRGSKTHLDYWLNHSLPVIIVLYNPSNKQTVWQVIEKSRIEITPKAWKIKIPITQSLDISHKGKIETLNKYPIYFQRLQRLAVHRELMLLIQNDEKIVVEIDEWINKSIGRVDIKIKNASDFLNEITLSEGSYIYFKNVKDLHQLFPWADFEIDEDYYHEFDHDDFLNEYGIWDSVDKELWTKISYEEYQSGLPKMRGIQQGDGEIMFYRLILSLNLLGNSFLQMDSYLENKED